MFKIRRKILMQGNSHCVTLSPELKEFLGVDYGDEVILSPEEKKKGEALKLNCWR